MTDRSQYEGWTHEVWLRCRFEETARWQRESDENDPTLACVEIEGDAIPYVSTASCAFTTSSNIAFCGSSRAETPLSSR